MRLKRWRRFGLVGVSLLLVATALWFLSRPSPRLTKAIVAKLYDMRPGLTLAQVEELVKAPPGDYSGGCYDWDCVTRGGESDSATLLVERLVDWGVADWGRDAMRSPDDMIRVQRKMRTFAHPRLSLEAQATLRKTMQHRKFHGWWGRNRALIVEVDDNSAVRAILFRQCRSRPKGWFTGMLWRVDQWFEGDL